jgi:hypothetical protein
MIEPYVVGSLVTSDHSPQIQHRRTFRSTRLDANQIAFAEGDIPICVTRVTQRQTDRGLSTQYLVERVIEHGCGGGTGSGGSDRGAGRGATVGALRNLGFNAWGLESDPIVHDLTPAELRKFNLLGELTDVPFA